MRQPTTRILIAITLLSALALPATAAEPALGNGWAAHIRAHVERLVTRAAALLAWHVDRSGDEPARLSSHVDPDGKAAGQSPVIETHRSAERLSNHVEPGG